MQRYAIEDTNWNWWKHLKFESQAREEMLDLLQRHFIVKVSIEPEMRKRKYSRQNPIKKEEREEDDYLEILG